MIKSAYTRRLNPLINGKSNFITDSQVKLDALVHEFVIASFTHYSHDGNVKHVEGAVMAMTYLIPQKAGRVQGILFKAFKELRANHHGFKLTIPLMANGKLNPLEHSFTYKKLDKKLRPATLPSLERTLREVQTQITDLFVKKTNQANESQKLERELKRTTNDMLDFSKQVDAMKVMGLQDRAEWIKGITALLAEADKLQNPAKYTKAKRRATPSAKAKAKAKPAKAKAKPKAKAQPSQKAKDLKAKMETKRAA